MRPLGVVGASVYVNGVFAEDSDPEACESSAVVKSVRSAKDRPSSAPKNYFGRSCSKPARNRH